MKINGKKWMLAGFAAVLALSLTACSGIQEHAYGIAEKTDHAVTMPEQYRITYEVQRPGEESVTRVTKACDAEGNIYFSSGAKEILFLKEGEDYRLYEYGLCAAG